MAKKRIVATGPIGETAIEILQRIAPIELSPAPDEETLMGFCEDTIAFVSRGVGAVTGAMIAASGDLEVIGRPGAGYDTVDIAAAPLFDDRGQLHAGGILVLRVGIGLVE